MRISVTMAHVATLIPDVPVVAEVRDLIAGIADVIHIVETNGHNAEHGVNECVIIHDGWSSRGIITDRWLSPLIRWISWHWPETNNDAAMSCQICMWDIDGSGVDHKEWLDELLRISLKETPDLEIVDVEIVDGNEMPIIIGDDGDEWTEELLEHREWLHSDD